MFCTKCGAPLEGGKFCTMCGEPVKAAAPAADICKNCGNELKGSKFCVMCGTPVNAEPAHASEPAVEYIPEPVAVAEPEPVIIAEPEPEPIVVSEPEPEIIPEPVVEEEPEPMPEPVAETEEAPASGDVCVNCGAPLEGRAFCIMCGTRAGEAPAPVSEDVCKNCGADLNGKAFCVVCGTPKDGAKPAPAPAPADNCTNCGAPLNGKAFCVVCGTAKSGAAPVKQTAYVPPVQPVYTPAAPVISPLKKAFGSGKFLVTAIFVTLYLLISIIAGNGDLGIPGMPVQLKASVSFGANSVSIVPILIAVGMWITYATAKGSGKLSSAGLSIIRVIMLLGLIGGWIGFVLIALAGLVFFVPGLIMAVTGESSAFGGFVTTRYAPGAALALGIAILIAAGVMLIFVLLFYRRLHLFAKSAVKSVKADKAEFKYASAMRGWLMFFGVVACIGAAILVIVGLAVHAGGIAMYGVASLCSAVATICGSSWIKSFCLEN